jgi:hypothetical protein
MGEAQKQGAIPWVVKHGLAGSFAGAVATTLLQPLDLIKTRFQGNQTLFYLSKFHS